MFCFLFYEPFCEKNLITKCHDLGLSCLQKLWKWKLKPKTMVISGARFMSFFVWIGPMTTVSGHQKWSWIYELTNAQPLSHGHLIKSLGSLGQLGNEIWGAIEQLQHLGHFFRNLFVKIENSDPPSAVVMFLEIFAIFSTFSLHICELWLTRCGWTGAIAFVRNSPLPQTKGVVRQCA